MTDIIVPEDINFLSPTGYRLSMAYLKNISYFVQRITLPGVSLGYSDESTPHRIVPLPGENLDYEVFSAEFLIDEKMKNYMEIYEWIKGLSFPSNRQEYTDYLESRENDAVVTDELSKLTSDGMVEILDSSSNSVVKIKLIDIFPIYLGNPHFDSTLTDVTYLVGRVDFKINRFEFV